MNNKIALLVFCIFTYSLHEISAQDFELAGFKMAIYPETKVQDAIEDIKFSFLEYNAFINIPIQLKNKKTVLINGFDYIWVESTAYDMPNTTASNESELLDGISYNFRIRHAFNDNWALLGLIKPTLAGDFESKITEKYFVLQSLAMVQYNINDFWSIGGGLAYTMRFGEPAFIPLFLLDYKKGKHVLNTVLPAKVSYDYSLGSNDIIRIGAQFMANGGQFYITNTQTNNMADINKLTYSRINAGVHMKYRLKEVIRLSAAVGVSNRRQYRLFDSAGESYDYDLQQTPVLSIGVALVPKKK